nr:MAG TPA: hypothetical protein [Caudoviricetes sp.]
MLKKYYTLTTYTSDEITIFTTQEIYARLLSEKFPVDKARAISVMVGTMEPMDYCMFDNNGEDRAIIRCWTYEND